MNGPVSSLQPGVLMGSTAARVSLMAQSGCLALRARGDLSALDHALGLILPRRIGQCAGSDGVQAICLGPDEWTILTSDAALLIAACADIYADHPHSLTDISGREVTLLIDGPRAVDLLTLGCPRDIESIPVGEGRRTICDGVTVVLWRDAPDVFRMDIWHSFAPHLLHLFRTGCAELAAEAA